MCRREFFGGASCSAGECHCVEIGHGDFGFQCYAAVAVAAFEAYG